MLMVDGNLELNGGTQWYGPILVRGSLSYTGGGQKNVTGGILAGGNGFVDDIGGNAVILHSNSALHQVIGKMPLTVLRWGKIYDRSSRATSSRRAFMHLVNNHDHIETGF